MVTLKKRVTKGKLAYYLSHTYRQKGKVKYKETFIGNTVPSNISTIKKEFAQGIYKEKWFVQFEAMKKAYSAEQHKTPPSVKEKNMEAFAVRFTYDTDRIEGSKLTLRETGALLVDGISPKDKPIKDVKEAEAHRSIFYKMLKYKGDLSIGIVLAWHKELLGETERDIAGKIRDYGVYITNSPFRPPSALEVQSYILEFFRWYDRESPTMNPVELAARAHLKFETIHPFGNGNGRIGRIIMNFILHRNGYPMIDIRYLDRRGYYRALERSQMQKDEGVFVQWFFKRYAKQAAHEFW
jgi:Fic family protein